MSQIIRILALETSGRRGSAALLQGVADDCHLIAHRADGGNERTAQTLVPSIQSLLNQAGWSPKSINLVAVSIGPGSFTGLRIGVITAKSFAYATKAHVLGIHTLDVIASQSPPSKRPVWVIMDAQRQELFTGQYSVAEPGECRTLRDTCVVPQSNWLTSLEPGERVTGPALIRLTKHLPAGVEAVADELWHPTAAAVGQRAWHAYRRGQRDNVWSLAPKYYRASAAEEKNPLLPIT